MSIQERKMGMIQTINVHNFKAIIDNWRENPNMIPKKQWLTFNRGLFLVIDNTGGKCIVHEFTNVDAAIAYSKESNAEWNNN